MTPSGTEELAYKIVAGAVPSRNGWLLVSARLKGATFAPDFPRFIPDFYDVVHRRPLVTVLALNAPIGDPEGAALGQRNCDHDATALLQRDIRESRWIGGTPASDHRARIGDGRTNVSPEETHPYADVEREMAPYLQRTVCEVVPELSFFQLNTETPLRHPPFTPEGYDERRALLAKVPGVSRILDDHESGATPWQLLEGCALLCSARRIAARAAKRVPADPEWDERGLRIEILR